MPFGGIAHPGQPANGRHACVDAVGQRGNEQGRQEPVHRFTLRRFQCGVIHNFDEGTEIALG